MLVEQEEGEAEEGGKNKEVDEEGEWDESRTREKGQGLNCVALIPCRRLRRLED